MTPPTRGYYAGIDTHSGTHTIALLDRTGAVLSTSTHDADPAGYDGLLALLDPSDCLGVGVEGTNSYGAAITRRLLDAGHAVYEVLRPGRVARRRDGKSDPIDAVEAARSVISGQARALPKDSTGWAEALRVLTAARDRLVETATALSNCAFALLVTAPEDIRERYRRLDTPARMRALARCRPAGGIAAEAVLTALREQARAWRELTGQARNLERRMRSILETHAAPLLDIHGVGTIGAARLAAAIGGDATRIRNEAALAKLCGACPIPASSGKTNRHRLNRSGHRQANRVLHQAAVTRLQRHEPTRAYAARRTREGKTKPEIIRCLKRYIVREVWQALKRIANGQTTRTTGTRLRELRKTHGITQQQIAQALNIAPSRISEIETGKRTQPELEQQCLQYIHNTTNTPTQQLDTT